MCLTGWETSYFFISLLFTNIVYQDRKVGEQRIGGHRASLQVL